MGTGGTILSTHNGGAIWTRQSSGTSATLRNLQFITGATGLVVGDSGTLLRSDDAGASWRPLPISHPTTRNLLSVYFDPVGTSQWLTWNQTQPTTVLQVSLLGLVTCAQLSCTSPCYVM